MSRKSNSTGCWSCITLILFVVAILLFLYDYGRVKDDVKELKKQVETMNAQ